jgi:PAS domain S-box-containing protein
MRAGSQIREVPNRLERSFETLLERFSASIRELKPSLGPSEFVRRFASHAAKLFGARAGLVVLARGKEGEIASPAGASAKLSLAHKQRLMTALTRAAACSGRSGGITEAPAAKLLGRTLAGALGWSEVVLVPLSSSEGDLQGALCLADLHGELSDTDRHLLEALASHASVGLENARLFSRIEQSRKQWVEDFDAITDFIVVHDAKSVILRVNRALAEFLGVPLFSLIGREIEAVRELGGTASASACPFCRNRSVVEEDYIHTAQERVYLVSTSRLRGGPEEEPRTIHVLKDITDRQELERRYRELFDNIQEGLFFCTPEGRFLEVNQALVRMLGYDSDEELLRVNLFDQLCLQPDRRRSCLEEVEKKGILRNHEEVVRRKDGTIVHTLQNLLAVRDAHGNIVQYRGLMLDITEQKMFQVQLQRERDFNKNILNNTQSMILVLDTAGLVSYANQRCWEAGYSEENLLGRPLVELVPSAGRPLFAEALGRALNGAPVDNLEVPVRRDDGRAGQFSVSLCPMRDEQANINSIVVVMTDITDAADLQAKLMHTEKMAAVGQLVSGVAHEVNNPLAAILGFTDLLLENPDLPDAAKEELRVILQEAQRTKVIVQNLLSFARQMPAQREPVQVNLILQQTLKLRTYDFSNQSIDVIARLDESLPLVIGDAHQLQQVFLNILNNAFDAVQETRQRARIEIESSRNNDCIEVRFRDNGPGISHPDRIFEPFFTTKEVGKGTGLGLSICYGIVRAHHGEVSCHNNPDGAGCTFVVRLPMVAAAAPVATAGIGK